MTSVFPLTTARLIIDLLGPDDVDAFVAYRRLPDVARYQSWELDYPRARAEELVAGQAGGDIPPPGEWIQYGIRRHDDGTLVGDVAVHTLADQPDTYEIGCTLAPAAQRKGYAVEAVGAVLRALFHDRGAHRVFATCDTRNTASIAALESLGMRHESSASRPIGSRTSGRASRGTRYSPASSRADLLVRPAAYAALSGCRQRTGLLSRSRRRSPGRRAS